MAEYKELVDELDDSRRNSVLEWRESVQEALNGKAKGKSQYDLRQSSSSSILLPLPHHRRSWRIKFPIWPWILRASHTCGHTILLVLTQSTSLAVEDRDYRDSFNALGVDTVEYQWQTWNLSLEANSYEPAPVV